MEEWQIQHIKNNLAQLIAVTKFNTSVKAALVSNNVLDDSDLDELDALQNQKGPTAACHQYYRLLMGRTDAYQVLTKVLMQYSQSGAAKILVRVPFELFGGTWICLGILTQLKDFQHMVIQVHGKTFQLLEFFPDVDLNLLQKIFESNLHQTEFYDTFISKERKFVLANNTVPPKPSIYLPRFLTNRIILPKSIFKADCREIFVVKNNIERHRLSQILKPNFTESSSSQLTRITSRFIYLDDNDWIELKKLANDPIHLISYENSRNLFVLDDSSGASDLLNKHGSREQSIYTSEDEFVQDVLYNTSTSSNVCICDTPGMGKTLLLQNIARKMINDSAGRIIAYIPLKKLSPTFSQFPSYEVPIPEVVLFNLLKYITTSHTNADLLLVKLIKENMIKLEIFFDGYEEIPPAKVDWMKQVFLQIITEFPEVRIFITSRPHMRHKLEKNIGGVAYDILPFDQRTQLKFLFQFWRENGSKASHILLRKYASSCLKTANSSLSNYDKEIIGTPLLCKLIAVLYDNKKP